MTSPQPDHQAPRVTNEEQPTREPLFAPILNDDHNHDASSQTNLPPLQPSSPPSQQTDDQGGRITSAAAPSDDPTDIPNITRLDPLNPEILSVSQLTDEERVDIVAKVIIGGVIVLCVLTIPIYEWYRGYPSAKLVKKFILSPSYHVTTGTWGWFWDKGIRYPFRLTYSMFRQYKFIIPRKFRWFQLMLGDVWEWMAWVVPRIPRAITRLKLVWYVDFLPWIWTHRVTRRLKKIPRRLQWIKYRIKMRFRPLTWLIDFTFFSKLWHKVMRGWGHVQGRMIYLLQPLQFMGAAIKFRLRSFLKHNIQPLIDNFLETSTNAWTSFTEHLLAPLHLVRYLVDLPFKLAQDDYNTTQIKRLALWSDPADPWFFEQHLKHFNKFRKTPQQLSEETRDMRIRYEGLFRGLWPHGILSYLLPDSLQWIADYCDPSWHAAQIPDHVPLLSPEGPPRVPVPAFLNSRRWKKHDRVNENDRNYYASVRSQAVLHEIEREDAKRKFAVRYLQAERDKALRESNGVSLQGETDDVWNVASRNSEKLVVQTNQLLDKLPSIGGGGMNTASKDYLCWEIRKHNSNRDENPSILGSKHQEKQSTTNANAVTSAPAE